MAHDLFISYSHKDKNAADAVCAKMEENGIRCWIAPRDITPGAAFAEAIIDGIKGARVFILIYSSNSNHSQQVIKEVDRAVHHGLAIIPLRLEDIPMSKQLEYYLSDVHWLDALAPPLEKYISKLCNVVQMLLKIDEADNDDVREVLETGSIRQDKQTASGRRVGHRKLLIASVIGLMAIVIAGSLWFFNRQAEIRWAREVALPEIAKLIEENDVWRNLAEPYRLAEQAEEILGDDPDLAKLFSHISLKIDVITDPPGAKAYMKEYGDTVSGWTYLGITPIEKIRVPVGIFRWKFEKPGYDTIFAAASTWKMATSVGGKPGEVIPYDMFRKLDSTGNLPPGMVRVPATGLSIGTLNDFFIGRYEVTNREYSEFVDSGGYRNRNYWKHTILSEGLELTWEEAMKVFVDQSGLPGPSTWMGGYPPEGQENYPVSGVSWYEAEAFAEFRGMRLPSSFHWNVARGGLTPMIQVFQLGGFAILAPFSNFSNRGPVPVGSLQGVTAYGAYDMAGNVREWCWNETTAGRAIRGGAWEDNTYEFGNQRQAPPMDRSRRNGIRLASYPDRDSIPEEAFAPLRITESVDISAIQPVSDDIFRIYSEQFAYDPMDLNPLVEYSEKSPGGWIREKISYNAAYGGERILAYLFLPGNTSPPFQTVIYFPGSAATGSLSSEDLENYYEFPMFVSFLIKNGRAVLFPVYKGTFERSDPALRAIHPGQNSFAYTEFLIQLVKDFRTSIDYLETRPDIDTARIAFYGMSWGGVLGTIIPAVEKRLDASIMVAGGFGRLISRPEANPVNYVTRITIPTLMLNGKYDINIDGAIKPAFSLMGTPDEHKRLILYETDHIPPRAEFIKETLAWLDRYLGPVNKD
ncbi:TIR domain-containing protein [bacterium]|nr:TIR domain-containing protein [bacterium]